MKILETNLLTKIEYFKHTEGKDPQIIIMHPILYEMFKNEVNELVNLRVGIDSEHGRIARYHGIEIITSVDVNKAEFRIY